MACLHPRKRLNPKYLPNSKNGGNPPVCPDPRLKYITFDCGLCEGCLKKKANDWRIRLHHEYRYSDHRKFHFVSFTYADHALSSLREYCTRKFPDAHVDDNFIVKVSVRLFLERYRKHYGVSLRHFFVTELGEKNGRIHLHGVIIDCKAGSWRRGKFYTDHARLSELWSYGYVWLGWCNERTISYTMKYISKRNLNYPDFKPIILVSPGFGIGYCNPTNIRVHHQHPDGIWYIVSSNGYQMSMPRYYRTHIFTEYEREQRQLFLLDNPPPYRVRGMTFDSLRDYLIAREVEYLRTLSQNTSYSLPPYYVNNFDPNLEFQF